MKDLIKRVRLLTNKRKKRKIRKIRRIRRIRKIKRNNEYYIFIMNKLDLMKMSKHQVIFDAHERPIKLDMKTYQKFLPNLQL